MENPTVQAVLDYIREQYGVEPDYLWARTPNCAAIRHPGTKKWFAALLMDTSDRALGLPGEGERDVINVKCDPRMIGSLLDGRHYLPGYHMNKDHWISIVLDGDSSLEEICPLIDLSYSLTAPKRKGNKKGSDCV